MFTLKKISLMFVGLALLLYAAYNINQQRSLHYFKKGSACDCNKLIPACIEVERIAGDQISYYQNPLDSEAMRDYYEQLKNQCCGADPNHSCCERNLDRQAIQNESHAEVS